VRALFLLLLSALPAVGAAHDADGYFELGLAYLKTGFFGHARAAFAESLLLAPGEAVPTVFIGLAASAERRSTPDCAYLLRLGYRRLPKDRSLSLDLRELLPSARALALIHADYTHRLRGEKGFVRRDVLTVLAFLEVHDGAPEKAPALEALLKLAPKDAFALALAKRPQGAA
jgi:tetratricopeptide (TPR) repeat protein